MAGQPRTGRRADVQRYREAMSFRRILLALVAVAAVIAVLLGVVVVLATGLTVVFMMIPLGIVYAVFEWLY